MVDPISDAERSSFYRKLRLAIVVLVGGSAGLITLQADVDGALTAGVIALGLAVGAAIAWFVVPAAPPGASRRDPSAAGENPFADGSGEPGEERERRR